MRLKIIGNEYKIYYQNGKPVSGTLIDVKFPNIVVYFVDNKYCAFDIVTGRLIAVANSLEELLRELENLEDSREL